MPLRAVLALAYTRNASLAQTRRPSFSRQREGETIETHRRTSARGECVGAPSWEPSEENLFLGGSSLGGRGLLASTLEVFIAANQYVVFVLAFLVPAILECLPLPLGQPYRNVFSKLD